MNGPEDQCSASGPCEELRAAIGSGTIQLLGDRAATQNGARLCNCFFCGSSLDAAKVAAWPWKALRAAGSGV